MKELKKNLSFRQVTLSDELLLFDWANDIQVRNSSFKKNIITLNEHKNWFNQKLNDKNMLMLIFEVNQKPAGLVRFENKNNKVILNYLISSKFRGKGLGAKMLIMASEEVLDFWPNNSIIAYTLPNNLASIKTLENSGFTLFELSNTKNCYKLN